MKTNFEKVADFMKCGDQQVKTQPEFPCDTVRSLRIKLIVEELNELYDADEINDMIGIADSLTDLLYVIYGMGHAFGIDLDKCFEEVHQSNMTKVVDGKLIKNEHGKVLKPSTYKKPDLAKVLNWTE